MPPQDPSFGPFTDILSKPLYEQTGVPPTTSGLGGKGEQSLFFVDKFLEGMQRGRQMQFERHEQDQRKLYGSIQDAYQRIEQANVPDDVKEQARGKLDALRIGVMAKHVDDATGKGGKGGKGGEGQGKEQQMLHFVKSGLDAMIGPRPKQYEMGQEQINNGLLDVYSSISDPKNNVQNRLAELDKNFSTLYAAKSKAAGRPLTQAEVAADPAMHQLLTHQGSLTGNKSLAMGTAQLMSSLEPGDEQSRLLKQKTEAEIERDKAQAEATRALAKDRSTDVIQPYVNAEGKSLRWNETQGHYIDDDGTVIKSGDPRTIGARPANKPPTAHAKQFKATADGLVGAFNPDTGKMEPIPNPLDPNQPLKASSSLGRALLLEASRQGNREKLEALRTADGFDRTIATLKKTKGYDHNPTLQSETARLEQEKRNAQERAEGGTETPPGGSKKKGKKQESGSAGDDQQILNMFKSLGGMTKIEPPKAGDAAKGWAAGQ